MYICEYCGKEVHEKYGSGRFCSRSCSNGWVSKNQSDEAKRRKIEAGKSNLRPNPESLIRFSQDHDARSEVNKSIMSDPVIRKKISDKLKGRIISEESRKKISEKLKLSHQEGRNKGWTTRRKQESYAEKFWRLVLENNNIPYEQEKKVLQSDLGMTSSHFYFLDFYLPDKNVDLEIDGHQHYEESRKQHDAIRDENLRNAGYLVYRIKYVNPNNSLRVQEDIDNFLSWYYSLEEVI